MTYTYTPSKAFLKLAEDYIERSKYELPNSLKDIKEVVNELALELEGACDDRWVEVQQRIEMMLKGANHARS